MLGQTVLNTVLNQKLPRLVDCPRVALGWTAEVQNYRAHCLNAKKLQLS